MKVDDVTDLDEVRRGKTKPQKNAGAATSVSLDDLLSDDDVVRLTALKTRAAEMLAKPDIHERDLKSVSLEFRAICAELAEAKANQVADGLGKRGGLTAVAGGRSINDDI